MKIIFVDHLNLSAFLNILLINSDIQEVKILSNIDSFSRIWIFLLRLLGFKVNCEKFFFGDIFDSKGESLYLVTRKIASIKSLEYSKWLLNKSSFIESELDLETNSVRDGCVRREPMFIEFRIHGNLVIMIEPMPDEDRPTMNKLIDEILVKLP